MTDIQRSNYFTSQFLVEEDFNEEQAYHREMRLRHNRSLHEWGVVERLKVSKTGEKQITVTEGMAIDKEGREIVILPDSPLPDTISLEGLELNETIELTIIYREIPEKPYEIGGETKYTRTNERPKFVIYGANTNQDDLEDGNLDLKTGNAPNDGTVIRLAEVTLDGSGNISEVDDSVRQLASAKLPSPRFQVGTVNTAENDFLSVPEGTNVDDWVIFVSPRELTFKKEPAGGFFQEAKMNVFAEDQANGWRIRCYSETDNIEILGIANYMLLRK